MTSFLWHVAAESEKMRFGWVGSITSRLSVVNGCGSLAMANVQQAWPLMRLCTEKSFNKRLVLAGDLKEPKIECFHQSNINTVPCFELRTMTAEGKCILGTEPDSGPRQGRYFTSGLAECFCQC